jgi:hypothetical protein
MKIEDLIDVALIGFIERSRLQFSPSHPPEANRLHNRAPVRFFPIPIATFM